MFTHMWLTTDVAHLGPAATRHLVTAVQLGEGRLTGMTFPDLLLSHLLLAGTQYHIHATYSIHLHFENLTDQITWGKNNASMLRYRSLQYSIVFTKRPCGRAYNTAEFTYMYDV